MENSRGILLMTLSMFAFATSDAFIKASNSGLNPGHVIFYIGLLGAPIFALMCYAKGQQLFTREMLSPIVTLRNIAELIGTTGIVCAIMYTSLALTSSIQQATPILVTMGAAIFLNETVGWRRWIAILFGFCCVLLIIRPGLSGFDANILFAVLGAIGLAARDLLTKKIGSVLSSAQISLVSYIALIPMGAALIYMVDASFSVPPSQYFNVFGMVVFAVTGYLALIASVKSGDISSVIPFRYSRIIFALFFAIVFFNETLDWQTLVGVLGLIISGLFVMVRERRTSALPSR